MKGVNILLRKLIYVAFLTVFLLFTFGCNSPDTKMEVYNNGIIQMEYPESWTPHEEDFTNIIITSFETKDKDFEITVTLSKLRDGIGAEEQFKLLEEEIKSLEKLSDDISLLESDIINIADQDAVEVLFLNSDRQMIHRIMTTFSDYLMSLETRSTEDSFKEYEDIINQIVNSLEIVIDD